jgi:hypothetical protein
LSGGLLTPIDLAVAADAMAAGTQLGKPLFVQINS